MKKKVLIFDDDVNILELCSIILNECGYEVETSETSHDIIEKVEKLQPDAILMDNWIPDIGGIEATRLLKSHPKFNHIPVIYFSANNDIKSLAEMAGADAHLAKPFDLDELENLIKTVLVD
ncbi:response regulator [Pedobacter sp. SD-b]|uniref:Response regulator n=1 Tax=Pedobacter segetis TaxID=2793069 RepID=A0ABS1BNL6_9SPHI|nr:response regulator [Pedobacter segetis]MBK0384484.1 response regulator [Pedobacter segetis]